jgi:hypothetical protein
VLLATMLVALILIFGFLLIKRRTKPSPNREDSAPTLDTRSNAHKKKSAG